MFKRIIFPFCLAIILFFSSANFLKAQLSDQSNFSLKLKGGVNLSSIRTDLMNSGLSVLANESLKNQVGWVAGLSARVGKSFFLQPELLLSQKGGQFASSITVMNVLTNKVYDLKYTNLDLPVLIGYKKGIFYGLAGPVASYTLSENSAIKEAVTNYYQDWKENKGLEKAKVGFQIGAGIQVLGITFDLRYETSFKNIVNQSILPAGIAIDSRQNLFQATVGFNLL